MCLVAAPVLVLLGLSIPEDDQIGWVDLTLWSIFGALAAIVPLLVVTLGRSQGWGAAERWRILAVATAALVGYWVIVVLPGVTSNTGFLQTLGVGAAVVGAWLLAPKDALPGA